MGCTQSGIQRRSRSHDDRSQGPATPVVCDVVPPTANATTTTAPGLPTTTAAPKGGCGAGVLRGNAHRFENNFPRVRQKMVNCDGVNDCAVPLCSVPEDGRKGTVALKFGSMYLTVPSVRVLFVFVKEDAQYNALKWASDKMHYEYRLACSMDEAVESYLNVQPHLVFIDARSKTCVDPIALCRTLRGFRGSQFSCIVAVVKKGLAEKEEAAIIPLLKSGFNRWFTETCSFGVCLNEMIQIEHNDLINLWKLRASEALFSALHIARDGVIITGSGHEIQFMNRAAEKLVGYSVEEMLGVNAQELHRTDSLKTDVVQTISTQLKKGKEWEGTLFHKRKSGECIPMWSKIAPVEIHTGISDHLVYIKECPFFMEKPFSPDADGLPYQLNTSLKSSRKASCDVRSLCSEVGMNRRQSFAKFHAMTIEAPITKVINMLVATQENSPVFVVQALDRVLEILRSTELYNPQLGVGQGKSEDQMTSDLVSGLITTGQKPTGVRRLSHETGVVKVNVTTPSTTLPSLSTAPSKIKDLLESDVKWEFDIIELETLSGRRPLIWLGLSLFSKLNVHTSLDCDDATIRNWLQLVESHYLENPYHNSTHAGDVMQATAYFLLKLRKKDIFDPLDEAICLISAVVHDIDHPGKSSPFLCNSDNELAILYNDRSVLESHHAAFAFKLTLSDEKVNIFQNLEREVYRTVRLSVIDMVLATEMTKHFEHLSKFLNAFQKPIQEDEAFESEAMPDHGDSGLRSAENIILIKRMLIKCSDVSNPARPIQLCSQWASRIAEEYCAQTDEEKRRGLPVVMPAFDRATCSIANSQTGFINYFVRDMFRAWSDFGEFPELMEYIEKNYIYWKDKEPQSNK
ncbi:high affinity cAMP-specific and IBMX-insensitive 3',5'-cyclic phosphodiesterase 8B [Ixodes scapularis]|uniref:high affinity cAMP-specific and IBMX-insensitive 3',5'-cyclic phosphodiesterase 8B n=1 Tax=Ixodes scapularis TaxID=6945 RepID=UPI001C393F5D|nr:high affinity cAMP-specific and IBMX-insensitive 3',5'-cyclic phosphodiesterase 8B [Ixodes scapularis]